MTECANCEEPIVRLEPIGWMHPSGGRDYSTRCEVDGPFRGLRAEPVS